MENRNKLLVICGVSGSGKSTLEKNLMHEYPDIFHKWQQVTTRKPRVGERWGDPYVFLERSTFEKIKNVLVGRLGVAPDTMFKDCYGSFPDFVEGKISTVILAEEAIKDLMNDKSITSTTDIFVYGLDVNTENLNTEARREGRDNSFLDKERTVLKYADASYKCTNGRYLPPNLVYQLLMHHGFIEPQQINESEGVKG